MNLPDAPYTDIGHGHACLLVEEDGVVLGVWLRHECPSKPWHNEAGAYIPLSGGGRAWTLESRDPLSIAPSVHFTDCGDHGFIRGGKWVPA